MRWIKYSLVALLVLIVLAFAHYTLPQTDVVRIADTYEKRIDFGENSIFWAEPDVGSATGGNRDVFFIQAIQSNGAPMVYRNEDTGWGWPPYFKFDTSNLQTQAADLKSTKAEPNWVAIRHYGWRNEFFSIFPNAISVWEVDGPEDKPFPWLNIVLLAFLALVLLVLRAMWRQFRERVIDPALGRAGDRWEAVDRGWDDRRGRVGRWLDSWKGRRR